MRNVVVAAAVCIAAISPAAAHAGTATAGVVGDPQATYVAADGEANDLTVRIEQPGESFVVVFEDAGAPVEAGDGCVQDGPDAARCTLPHVAGSVTVITGDEDDDVRLVWSEPSFSFEVFAGSGDDEVTGSGSSDRLHGEAGVDTMDGGLGDDRIDGGGNTDTVHYGSRSLPIDVDLARGSGNGEAGENDDLTEIENVQGGLGGGRLAGDAGRNFLAAAGSSLATTAVVGRAGADTLLGSLGDDDMNGGRGRDSLIGAGGRDTLRGGRGDDDVQPAFKTPESNDAFAWARAIHCGTGFDLVHDTREHDLVPPDCERVHFGRVGVSPRVRRVGDEIDMRLTRIYPEEQVDFCRAAVAVLAPNPQSSETPRRRRIAHGAAGVLHGREVRVRLELNEYGRQLVARNANPLVLVRATGDDRCKGPPPDIGSGGFTARLAGAG